MKIIFITGGDVDIEAINEAKKLADQYIFKPYTYEIFKEKVNAINLKL